MRYYNNGTGFHGNGPDWPSDPYAAKCDLIRQYVILFVCPLLVIGGTAGNILALMILRGRRFQGSTTSFLLSSLAVVDTLALMNGPLRYWFKYLLDWDIRTLGAVSCKVQTFVTFVCTHLSAWTIVLVTIERAFMVLSPARAPRICRKRNAYIAWTTLVAVLVVLDAHFFWTFTYIVDDKKCDFTSSVWMNIWGWIDVVVVCVLPFVIILVLNCLVVFQLSTGQKRLRRSLQRSAAATRSSNRRRDIGSVTRMLVVVSFVFLFTTLPSSVLFAGYPVWFPPRMTPAPLAESELVTTVVNVVFYTNNAANFVLYILSGRAFRRAFKEMFLKKCSADRDNTAKAGEPKAEGSQSDASSVV